MRLNHLYHNIIYSYNIYCVFCISGGNSRFYVFHLILFHDRGTLAPPAFKFICSRRNVSLFWNIWALCAVAWANVAEACPGME